MPQRRADGVRDARARRPDRRLRAVPPDFLSGNGLMAREDLVVCFDGASRGNPGRAAIGVVVLKDGVPIREIGEAIGQTTNNIAEYRALLRGLEEAAALGA